MENRKVGDCHCIKINACLTITPNMRKGVELTFKANGDDDPLVEALANVTGWRLQNEMDVDWRVFHVTYGKERFYRVLFTGKKLGFLHPHEERKVKEVFDETAHMGREELIRQFRDNSKKHNVRKVQELREEQDLWQDPLWNYI